MRGAIRDTRYEMRDTNTRCELWDTRWEMELRVFIAHPESRIPYQSFQEAKPHPTYTSGSGS